MNLPPAPPLIRPPARRPWFWAGLALLLLPFVAFGVIALAVVSCLNLSSDTRALRNGLMKASGVEWRHTIGLNLGRVTLGAVRAGLSFASLDSEVQAAVQAVRGVEVGIYELAPGSTPPDRATMLTVADKVLNARGWARLVGVLDADELVGVYVPGKTVSARAVKCCVLVFDGRQMIVVAGRVNVAPLVQCLQSQTDLRACGFSGQKPDQRKLHPVATGGARANTQARVGW